MLCWKIIHLSYMKLEQSEIKFFLLMRNIYVMLKNNSFKLYEIRTNRWSKLADDFLPLFFSSSWCHFASSICYCFMFFGILLMNMLYDECTLFFVKSYVDCTILPFGLLLIFVHVFFCLWTFLPLPLHVVCLCLNLLKC